MSLPSRGAWIEISSAEHRTVSRPSLPSRGAWIEIIVLRDFDLRDASLPSRGAWIEIRLTVNGGTASIQVAPLTGSVD